MKKTRSLLVLLVILLSGLMLCSANAMGGGFSMEELNQKQQEHILQSLNIVYLSKAPILRTFEDFDVNSDGRVVTGSDVFPLKTLCVYDTNGKFQYGYTFITSGAYDIEWSENNILVYTVRGDIAFSLNNSGKCTEIKRIEKTLANEDYRRTLQKGKKQFDHTWYVAENISIPVVRLFFKMFPYTKIAKVDMNGTKTVVLNCCPKMDIVVGYILIVTFIVAITATVVVIKIQRNRGTVSSTNRSLF